MSDERFASFDEFWPYYVGEHLDPLTRKMHFVGTAAAVTCFLTGVATRRPALILGALVAGYGPAWISHFFVEKNRPATFTYPKWSLLADFKMWGLMAVGEMDAEVEKVKAARAAEAKQNGSVVEPAAADMHTSSVLN